MLKGNPSRVNPEKDNSKMPVSVLNALPRAIEQYFNPKLVKNDNGVSDILMGRYITLFFSLLIILLVFTWSRELYGINAGLFSAFLFVCCPNNIANAVLVTTDTYSVFFLLATMFFLWRYCNSKQHRDFVLMAVMLALSQLVKQSLFHLYILVPLCIVIFSVVNKEKIQFVSTVKKLFIVVGMSWLVINLGFLFWHWYKPLHAYTFMSNLFRNVQLILPGWLPVPLSESFITGLDQAKFYDQLGGGFSQSSFANVTIMGHSSTGGSFWYYYFVSIFFKTPIAYFIIIGWATYLLVVKSSFKSFINNQFFLLAPIFYFLLLMSFLYKTQCGIRHIIFIYPLLFIYCGYVVNKFTSIQNRLALIGLSIWLLISVGGYFNNYYPYTNEFIGRKENAWKYVGSANLNFTQAEWLLDDYLHHHPEINRAPETAQVGKFVLSVDNYLDVWNTGKYKWLRKITPIGEVHYSYLLFDVKQKDIEP